MSNLRLPVRYELDLSVAEEDVQRIWAGVRRRRGAGSGGPPALRWGAWAFAFAVSAVAVLWVGRANWGGGPLLARDGRTVTSLGKGQAALAEFTDGSRVEVANDGELEVLDNTARSFVSVLRAGRGSFDITPGGPRRWVIEAGLASVEVVGTQFSVNRTETAVVIEVSRGVVLVRSDRIADRVQRLTAGQRLVVRDPAHEPARAPDMALGEPQETAPVAPSASPVSAVNEGVRSGPASVPTFDELLSVADARRRSGDVRGAEEALRRALSTYRSHPSAALAAFTLGRLLFDSAGRPAEAARAFSRCLELSPPAALAEDALARLVEAEARAGHTDRARVVAEAYRRRYPAGRWLRDMERWAGAR